MSDVPQQIEPGVLYVSMEYATAIHSCCCGCGGEVVTPLSPTDWRLTYDGESVSLWPSVGNWGFDCRSHYIIDGGNVVEAQQWSDAEIAAGRRHSRHEKQRFYSDRMLAKAGTRALEDRPHALPHGTLRRLRKWFTRSKT